MNIRSIRKKYYTSKLRFIRKETKLSSSFGLTFNYWRLRANGADPTAILAWYGYVELTIPRVLTEFSASYWLRVANIDCLATYSDTKTYVVVKRADYAAVLVLLNSITV